MSGEGSGGLHWGVWGGGRYGRDEGEVGKRRGDAGIIPTVNEFAHTRAGRVKLKYLEG